MLVVHIPRHIHYEIYEGFDERSVCVSPCPLSAFFGVIEEETLSVFVAALFFLGSSDILSGQAGSERKNKFFLGLPNFVMFETYGFHCNFPRVFF